MTTLLLKKQYQQQQSIEYSVVMPIFNQETIIIENIKSVIELTEGTFELLLILDFCFDTTEQKVMDFFNSYVPQTNRFIQVTIFKNTEKPLFETKCDNIGFQHSVGTYCLEIQADMKMTEKGYNITLTKPFLKVPNVFAVSGRCAHNVFEGIGIGKLGEAIEKSVNELNVKRNIFYVFETCNRGPLIFNRQKLKELGYLDEEHYFLDDSDHDIMIRAYLEKKYICGYMAIDFAAPIVNGSVRNTKYYNFSKEYMINYTEKEKNKYKMAKENGIQKYKANWISRQPQMFEV